MQHVTDGSVDGVAPQVNPELLRGAEHVDLAVAGMGCPSCGNRVRNALLACPSVVEVQVDVPAALARVWYHSSGITVDEIVAAVAVVGESTHHRFMATPVGTCLEERSVGPAGESPEERRDDEE